MPRISHVKDTKLNLDYGYMFDIQTSEELEDYWNRCRSVHIQDGIRDVLKCVSGKGHITTGHGSMVWMKMQCGENLIEAMGSTETKLRIAMLDTLLKEGRILVNTNGGYFFPHKHIEIVDTLEVKHYSIPGEQPVITRWPEGEHYYARVGNERVEWCGRNKWDTHKEALHAAMKFQLRTVELNNENDVQTLQ